MTKKDFSFNEAVIRIEEILKRIESGDLDLDKLSEEVKNASELINLCRKKLKNTEEELSNIFRDLA
jgi:exodeoxyribonuclease VII small subunit